MTRRDGPQKIADALAIIRELGLPRGERNERSALTLLALVDLRPGGSWVDLAEEKIAAIPVLGNRREMGRVEGVFVAILRAARNIATKQVYIIGGQ